MPAAQIIPLAVKTAAGRPLTLVPAGADKDGRYRLGKFQRWLEAEGQPWHSPDLAAYRDHLLAD